MKGCLFAVCASLVMQDAINHLQDEVETLHAELQTLRQHPPRPSGGSALADVSDTSGYRYPPSFLGSLVRGTGAGGGAGASVGGSHRGLLLSANNSVSGEVRPSLAYCHPTGVSSHACTSFDGCHGAGINSGPLCTYLAAPMCPTPPPPNPSVLFGPQVDLSCVPSPTPSDSASVRSYRSGVKGRGSVSGGSVMRSLLFPEAGSPTMKSVASGRSSVGRFSVGGGSVDHHVSVGMIGPLKRCRT
jgi:hypothetical protein